MKQLRQVAIVTAAACALAIMSGCETPGDTALLGGLLGGMAPYAKTAQGAASMAAMGSAASGYANAQASRSQITVNNNAGGVQPQQGQTQNVTNHKMDDGSVYSGPLLPGSDGKSRCHGYGSIKYTNGNSYTGEFANGFPDGRGVVEYANGRRYEGDLKRGKLDGTGTMTYPEGGKYVGEWSDNEKNGEGKIVSSNGYTYEGEWKRDSFHGQGVFITPDGTKSSGRWENGKHIEGTDEWPDGTKLVGTWKHEGKNTGTITWKDGREYKGDWKLVTGKPDLPDGEGAMTWPDGRKYVGEFRDGKMHGFGKMTYADGRTEDGAWKQGEFTGTQAASGKTDNKQQSAATSGKQGMLTVDSLVTDCEVFVDGAFMGNTPAKLRLSEGAHTIEVKKDGYKPYKKDVTVSEGSELTLRPSLQKE